MALSGLRLNCVVMVRLEVTLIRTVRFKVKLCRCGEAGGYVDTYCQV